jgi:predicted transposase/invertase (TIGR01784 family)
MLVTKFLDPKNDFAFKKIFGTERNKAILVQFLNDILCFAEGAKICDVTFLKPAQDPDIASKKQSIVDVLCVDQRGTQYIVEMQVARVDGFEKRAQYYAAKAYSGQMNNGAAYASLKEIIFLAIVDFTMFPDKPDYKSDHVILDRVSYTHDLKDFSFTFLELPKFHKAVDELSTTVEKWMYFFKHASHTNPDELEKLTADDTAIRKAYEVLDQFFWSEEDLRTYEQELKSQLDEQAILSAVRKEGRAEGIQEVAKNLRDQGMDIQAIVLATGLSPEEITRL